MNDRVQALRLRLRDDFEFYSKHCVKIRTRDKVEPFVLNSVQRRLHETIQAQIAATGKARIIILKGRQQGISTYASAYLYWRISQSFGKKGLVVAHKADSTKTIFDMYKRIHAEMPAEMKMSTRALSAKDLTFDKLDSGIKVETANGQGIGRGETLNFVHISEMGFWAPESAEDNFTGLKPSFASVSGSVVIIESTAFGQSGPFYELWQASVRGETEWIPFFSPWFDSEYSREEAPADYERTYEEEELAREYGLDNDQLNFRRIRIAEDGRNKFEQEYPSYPDEAFKSSGRPVFEPKSLHDMESRVNPIIRSMDVEEGSLRDCPIGKLKIYHEHDAGQTYYIGADVAHGQAGGDFSVAQVLDGDHRQVATWRGHINPWDFADILATLGSYYNTAEIACENNDAGHTTATRLGRDLRYENTYQDVREGSVNDVETQRYGFRTTEGSKPMIIDTLRVAIDTADIEVNDLQTLRELKTYVFSDSGRMGAQKKCHDDSVMSLAIANHIWRRRWDPIVVTDDFYVDAY